MYNTMPAGRIHKHNSFSKKKINNLIDKRLIVKAEKKVKFDANCLNSEMF